MISVVLSILSRPKVWAAHPPQKEKSKNKRMWSRLPPPPRKPKNTREIEPLFFCFCDTSREFSEWIRWLSSEIELKLDWTCRARSPEGPIVWRKTTQDRVRDRAINLQFLKIHDFWLWCRDVTLGSMSQHAKNVHSKQITLFSRSKSDSKKRGRTDGRTHARTDGRTDKHTSEFWGLYTIGPSGN